MKTLSQFKREYNINQIDLLQGKGRKYAQVRDIQLVVSKECDLKQPLFVTQMSEPIDDSKPIAVDNSRPIPGVYLVINASSVKVVEAL